MTITLMQGTAGQVAMFLVLVGILYLAAELGEAITRAADRLVEVW